MRGIHQHNRLGVYHRLRPIKVLVALTAASWLPGAPAHADIIDSASCPGALEERTAGGSVRSRIIPTGGTARCVTDPEPALGLEPYIRGSGGSITLIIDPDVLVPTFLLEGDGNTLENAGLASGTITGNGALISTASGSDLELAVTGNGTVVENIGALDLTSVGDLTNVANGNLAALSLMGDGAFVRNDPDARAQVFIAGSLAEVDNLGIVSSVEVNGDSARIRNEGSTGAGLDGVADGLGVLVVGRSADIVNAGQVSEFSEPGIADSALGIAVQGDDARIANQAGFVVVEGFDSVAVGIEGNRADISNAAQIGAAGRAATAVFVEGNAAEIVNAAGGRIDTNGAGSTGISVEGNGAEIENRGDIDVVGELASGVFVAGSGAQIRNVAGATITTQDGAVLAAGAFGDAATVSNAGNIGTSGRNAFGLAAIGLGAEVTNTASGVIGTNGSNADALVLGLQSLPPGAEGLPVPAGAFAPAQGGVTNAGTITTSGIGADGINAFADGSTISNRGTIDTDGNAARGIAVVGTSNLISNGVAGGGPLSGIIRTTGNAGHGIQLTGTGPIVEGDIDNHGLIQTTGGGAHGIVARADANIDNQGLILVDGPGSFGISSLGGSTVNNGGFIRAGDPEGTGISGTGGIEYAATQTVTNEAGAEILVFGSNGRGIFHDPLLSAFDASVDNAGSITVTGDNGIGVVAIGAAADQPATRVHNTGLIRAGIDGLLDPASPPDPALNPTLTPADSPTGVLLGGHTDVINEAIGRIRVIGDDGAGIAARPDAEATGASIINRGEISATGTSAAGIDVTGNDVVVFNGALTDSAKILVSGANSVGIRSTGSDQFISNAGALQVSGANSTLIEVNVTGPGELWVDSSTALNVSGDNAIAMDVRSRIAGSELRIADSATRSANCVGGGIAGGRVINCGGIGLGDNASAVGMQVSGIGDTFIENQAGIVGTGDRQRGIVVAPAEGLSAAEGQVNFVENLDEIRLTGTGSTGVVLNGSGNFLLNGTGVSRFEFAPGLPEGLTGTITSNIDKMVSRGTELGPVDSQQVGAQGIIEVEGIGARGLLVGGTGNLISNRSSLVIRDDTIEELPGRIVAKGSGSIGVELVGSGHVLDNDGLISGELFAVLADGGDQTVINKNTIAGDIALGGGADNLVFIPGASFTGLVDGGDGTDNLFVSFPGDADFDLDADVITGGPFDGDRFTNFENFTVDLEAFVTAVTMQNTLVVDTATIKSGVLVLDDAFLNAPMIRLESGTALTGKGMLGSLPSVDPDSFGVKGEISIATAARVGPGTSPGALTFLGDVNSSGLWEIEIGGLDVALHDVVNVEGDLTFAGGGIDFRFIDGFLPSIGDMFDIFDVSGLIAGLETLDFTFSGLPSGFGFDFALSPGGLTLATLTRPAAQAVSEPDAGLSLLAGAVALLILRAATGPKKGELPTS